MTPLLAAYELGWQVCLLRYSLKYAWDYGTQASDHGDDVITAIEEPLARIEMAMAALMRLGATGRLDDMRRLFDRIAVEARRFVATLRANPHLDGDPETGIPEPLKADCLALIECGGEVFQSSPQLHRWVQLGLAQGEALLFLVNRSHAHQMPSGKAMAEAAAALPAALLKKMPILVKLAQCASADRCKDAYWVCSQCLPAVTERYKGIDDTADLRGLWVVRALMALFGATAEALASHAPGYLIDLYATPPTHPQACVNGQAYEISHEQYLFLQSLLQREGTVVTGQQICADHPQVLKGARVDRIHHALPDPIRRLIRVSKGHHGGYGIGCS